jgi:hypothetical protein
MQVICQSLCKYSRIQFVLFYYCNESMLLYIRGLIIFAIWLLWNIIPFIYKKLNGWNIIECEYFYWPFELIRLCKIIRWTDAYELKLCGIWVACMRWCATPNTAVHHLQCRCCLLLYVASMLACLYVLYVWTVLLCCSILCVLKWTILIIQKHYRLFSCNLHIQIMILFAFSKLKVLSIEEKKCG